MVEAGPEVNREWTPLPSLPICALGPVPCPVSPGIGGRAADRSLRRDPLAVFGARAWTWIRGDAEASDRAGDR